MGQLIMPGLCRWALRRRRSEFGDRCYRLGPAAGDRLAGKGERCGVGKVREGAKEGRRVESNGKNLRNCRSGDSKLPALAESCDPAAREQLRRFHAHVSYCRFRRPQPDPSALAAFSGEGQGHARLDGGMWGGVGSAGNSMNCGRSSRLEVSNGTDGLCVMGLPFLFCRLSLPGSSVALPWSCSMLSPPPISLLICCPSLVPRSRSSAALNWSFGAGIVASLVAGTAHLDIRHILVELAFFGPAIFTPSNLCLSAAHLPAYASVNADLARTLHVATADSLEVPLGAWMS